MESIDSGEKLGPVSATAGEAPKHTTPGHELCAYHWSDHFPGDLPTCAHGEILSLGACYSEDMVNDIRRTSHHIIDYLQAGIMRKKFTWLNEREYELFIGHLEHLVELTR